ncbi:hypothetical protein [Limnobacter sp.]|uniref:hypothetical protein n=1 Tax=Limnobacter sp. TaxID=2003368 RepID=UPI00258CD62A|nr:hypothetical protein [Limnobacter sp.]
MQLRRSISLILCFCITTFPVFSSAFAKGLSYDEVLKSLHGHSKLLRSEIDSGELHAMLSQKTSQQGCGDIEKYYEPEYQVKWLVLHRDSNRVDFRLCPTDDVFHLHAYQYDGGRTLYVIAFESGVGHDTWSYEFWVLNKDGEFAKVNADEIGIVIPQNNDFLSAGQHLENGFDHEAKLYFDDGSAMFVAEPDLTQPEWRSLQPAYRIIYYWNGKIFKIKKILLKTQKIIR